MKAPLMLALGLAVTSTIAAAAAEPPRADRAPAAATGSFCDGLIAAVRAQAGHAPAVFIRSYQPAEGEDPLPAGLATTAFVYDNALAAIALVACGDVTDARRIGAALSRATRADRTFRDGRVRNAYRAGPVGDGAPLLPGWWDAERKIWGEDAAQDGTATGNVAWAALALLTLHQATGEASFRDDAARLVDWIATTTACDGGFCGGFHGYDPQQVRLSWISTEHNVDVAAAAGWLARLPGGQRFAPVAAKARAFLASAFLTDHFVMGAGADGRIADSDKLALDTQLWPWMALPDAPAEWRKALGFAELHLAVNDGFDFNGDRDGVWVEGTAQAALGYRIAGQTLRSEDLVAGLAADRSPNGWLYATRAGRVSTGLSIDATGNATEADFFYAHRPHLGATAWAVLAERGFNPFTGARVP